MTVAFIPTLDAKGAAAALATAVQSAEARGARVSIAVVDAAGNLLAFTRIGNAMIPSIDTAIAKARTAAQLGDASGVLQALVDGPHPSYATIPGLMPLRGGVPIRVDGEVVGGIAASGGSAEDDEAIASEAAAVIAKGAGTSFRW